MNHPLPSPEFTSNFYELAYLSQNIVITAHESPDEDSIASVLSVYDILTTKYPDKKIRIIYSGKTVERLNSFKNYDKIEFVPDMSEYLEGVDLVIMLDGSQFGRFSKQPEKLKRVPKTICIDHHSSPADEFTHSLICPTSSSCAEVVYHLLCADLVVSKELAELFMLGILGDTGNFTYLKPHQTETLSTAKKLLEIGKIEIQEFQSRYRTISQRSFAVIAELIKNTKYGKAKGWPNFQYTYIEREFKKENNYTDNEVSEASHIYMGSYLRTIDSYPWGFILTPKSNGDYSLSGRSLPGSVSVRDMFERMTLGGGHDRASGATFKKIDKDITMQEGLKIVLTWIKANKPKLI